MPEPASLAVKNEDGDMTEGEMKEPEYGADMGMMMGQRPEITVRITTDMMMAGEVQRAHSSSGDNNGNSGMKALRIKGYRAMVRTESERNRDMGAGGSEEAQAIVGGAFISVSTRGMSEPGQAEKFLALIDFDRLKGFVGE